MQSGNDAVTTKLDPLSGKEVAAYTPSPSLVDAIEAWRVANGVEKSEMHILDWGCGRGRAVLWLRAQGYQAYGVDAFAEPVENGRNFLRENGEDPAILQVLDNKGRSIFSDGFFDFVCSDQVLEHVADIEIVAREIARVMAPGGGGLLIYPAQWVPQEGHLFMPFTHWLPKHSALRRWAIQAYVAAGIEPRWSALADLSPRAKAKTYTDYLNQRTFYRPVRTVARAFSRQGLTALPETVRAEKIRSSPFFSRVIRFAILRLTLNWLLITFRSVHLHLVRPAS
jgi:SAM-dependent methyltransferase